MYAFLIIIAFAASLIIMLSIAKHMKSAHNPDNMEWLKQHGERVIATVTQVTAEGEWKYGSRYSRWNAWEGRYELEREWHTTYYVTAQWQRPETKQVYTFKVDVGSSAVAGKYTLGYPLPVIFNPRHPEQCYVELVPSVASK